MFENVRIVSRPFKKTNQAHERKRKMSENMLGKKPTWNTACPSPSWTAPWLLWLPWASLRPSCCRRQRQLPGSSGTEWWTVSGVAVAVAVAAPVSPASPAAADEPVGFAL